MSVFDLTDEELQKAAGGGAPSMQYTITPEEPKAPSSSSAFDVVRMSPEQLLSLANAQRSPTVMEQINQRAGSFATGANDVIAGTLGLPVDLAQGAANLGRRAYDYGTGSETPPFEGWPGSSAGFREKVFAPTVGRTEPGDRLDRLLYGMGSGLASVPTGFGVGAALNAAGRAPTIAAALRGGAPATTSATGAPIAATATNPLNIVSNLAGGVGGGAGSVLGYDAMDALTNGNPYWQKAGEQVGGLLGGIAGGIAPAAGVVTAQAADRALRPFTEQGRRDITGDILNRTITDRDNYGLLVNPQAEQPLGVNPTMGQRTNDPGLLRLDRTAKQWSPTTGAVFDEAATANNQIVREATDRLGAPAGRSPSEISGQAAPLLEENRQAARTSEQAAWRAIDPTGRLQTGMEPIRDRTQAFLDNLEMARRPHVPDDLVGLILAGGSGKATLPFREVQAIRSDLLGRERLARRQGDFNQANVLRSLDEAAFPGGEVPLTGNVDRATMQRYEAARQETRAYHETFDPPPLKSLFKADGTPDTAALDKQLSPGAGQAERVQQYVNASMAAPDLGQHARDWFTAKMHDRMNAAITQDNAGNQVIKPTELANFMRDNRALLNSSLFTPEQRRVANDMVEALRTLGRRPPADGSPTAANLQGTNYVSQLVGDWFKPAASVIGAGLGAAGGHLIPGAGALAEIGGAAAGAGSGGGLAYTLADRAYSGAADKVKNLLVQAMHNPDLARELLMRASRQNNQFASPQLRGLIGIMPQISQPPGGNYGGP